MTQFNLLPDIKIDYLKAQRKKRLIFSVSFLITLISVVLAASLFAITAFQRAQLNRTNADIAKQGQKLTDQKNLNELLTVQNQIQTLNTLHQQEPAVENLEVYLYQTIPAAANLSNLTISFNTDTLTLSGSADTLFTVNQLVDSLKFATYKVQGVSGSNQAFSNVVLSSFNVSPQSGVDFVISSSFAQALFNNTVTTTLNVPSRVTTRSELNQPTVLFKTTSGNGT